MIVLLGILLNIYQKHRSRVNAQLVQTFESIYQCIKSKRKENMANDVTENA